MVIRFRTLRGQPFELDINEPTSVNILKQLLQEKFSLVSKNINFIRSCEILSDEFVVNPKVYNDDEFLIIHEKQQNLRTERHITLSLDTALSSNQQNIPPPPIPAEPKPVKIQQAPPPPSPSISNPPSNPPSRPNRKSEENPGFNSQVAQLAEMGFNPIQAAEVLRAVRYDFDAAIQALITGELPEEPEPVHEEEEKIEIPKVQPVKKPREVTYDVSGLSRYSFGQFRSVVDQMTNREKHGLLRVLTNFANMETEILLQMYIACDKDPLVTEHCLNDH